MTTKIKDYESLKRKVLSIGLVIPGTLREMYHRCGKSYCMCMQSEEHRHGPYFLWDRKVGGKLASKSIPKEDVPLYKEWMENRKKLDEVVAEMIICGYQHATERQDLKKADLKKQKKKIAKKQ